MKEPATRLYFISPPIRPTEEGTRMLYGIDWYLSSTTGKRIPNLNCTALGDMEDDGTSWLTSIERTEVMLVPSNGWSRTGNREDLRKFEQQANAVLGRTDLRCLWWLSKDGKYRDPFDENEYCTQERKQSLSDYLKDGGKLSVADTIERDVQLMWGDADVKYDKKYFFKWKSESERIDKE